MIKSYLSFRQIITLCIISFFLFNTISIFSARKYAPNSVLSSGKWAKIKIENTGIYKLTYDDLKNMGLENPQNVKIYGYGGNVLSEDFSLNEYIDDLPQISLWMSNTKENFGSGDYILFYGKGVLKWTFDNVKKEFAQTQHPYSTEAFYFLTESGSDSKIATKQVAAPDNNASNITTYQDYYLHEKELTNISQTGRNFYGENFTENKTQSFNFKLDGAIEGSSATISYEFISLPKSNNASLQVTLNNMSSRTKSIDTATSSYAVATVLTDSYSQAISTNNSINFKYTEGSKNDNNTHLNYFRINYNKRLQPYGSVTLFRSTQFSSKLNFSIANTPQDIVIFDVTNADNMNVVEGVKNNGLYQFSAVNTSIKEYALVDLSQEIPKPTFVQNLQNQNLHSLEGKEMIIIVQPFLKTYAEQLAQVHLDDSGLESLIVYPNDIYNEFSSGTPDITAYRNFLKMLYDKANSQGKKAPRYLLLFGDGTYDNRLLSDHWTKSETQGFLLTYQSENSISEVYSFVTDDYVGFLDDTEGASLNNDKLDLGIGRLPVRTELEAKSVVNKIAKYLKNENPGSWQSNVIFLADDAIGSSASNSISERVHMVDSDAFADNLNTYYPDFRTTKLYMDSYERVVRNYTARSPEGKKQFLKQLNEGGLILNYMGHGSQNDWTHELVLRGEDINNMKNDKLPLWITATCDFSRFDYDATSAGELALLNPNGGAIALFSTVRVVFASSNKLINASMFEQIFTEEDGKKLRLGDIIRYAKTKSSNITMASDGNKLRFLLMGDPAIRLNYPSSDYKVKIETINNTTSSQKINLTPLSEVVIKGQIVDRNGNLDSDFNGTIETNVFDNKQNLATRGQANKTNVPSPEVALKYVDYVNKLYTGKANVTNGMFELSFIVPMDILYSGNNGKMFFSAFDSQNRKAAQGSYTNYSVVRGDDPTNKETTPPVINDIYINSNSFISGQTISDESTLYVHMYDDTGLNLAQNTGHGITATINNVSYDITNSFISSPHSSKSGEIKYQLPSLPEGSYTLSLKIWDVWNNSTTKSISFKIAPKENISYTFDLESKIVKDHLKLIFSTESKNSDILLRYKIFDKSNNQKWVHEEKGKASTLSNYTYKWNLTDSKGCKLGSGSYSLRLYVKIGDREEEKTYDFVVL